MGWPTLAAYPVQSVRVTISAAVPSALNTTSGESGDSATSGASWSEPGVSGVLHCGQVGRRQEADVAGADEDVAGADEAVAGGEGDVAAGMSTDAEDLQAGTDRTTARTSRNEAAGLRRLVMDPRYAETCAPRIEAGLG